MNPPAALDHALAAAADAEFRRLTDGLDRAARARRVTLALDSLHGSIRRRAMPPYADALVALFYCLWYHPFQVNAAYSLVSRIVESRPGRLTPRPRLRLIDFGCGALAAQFGFAFALLDLLARRAAIPPTRIDLIEPNAPMLRMGLNLWQRFLDAAPAATPGAPRPSRSRVDPATLSATARFGTAAIHSARLAPGDDLSVAPDAECWLIAMHAYYADRQAEIANDLRQLYRRARPELGWLTYHYASQDGINAVSPFGSRGRPGPLPPLRLAGELPRVNRWRRRLADALDLPHESRLTRPVAWNPARGPRDNRALYYSRGSNHPWPTDPGPAGQ